MPMAAAVSTVSVEAMPLFAVQWEWYRTSMFGALHCMVRIGFDLEYAHVPVIVHMDMCPAF